MLSVMGTFAEFERALICEQKATLAREFGISRETLYQYLKIRRPHFSACG